MRSYYKPGDWNAVCQVCGFTHKASELRRRWDGVVVCPDDFEMRNPQDLIQMPKEKPGIPWSSPEQYIFLTDNLDTQDGDNLTTEDGDNLTW
jgi:hypothetical protein